MMGIQQEMDDLATFRIVLASIGIILMTIGGALAFSWAGGLICLGFGLFRLSIS